MDSIRQRTTFRRLRKRGILFMVALLALVLFIAGCGGKKTEGERTLHFYMWKPNQPEVWDEIIAMFEAEHPGVKIRREIGPHSSTAFHDLLTQKLKNKSRDLDVFLMDVVWPAEFAAAGWAMPLDDRFPGSEQAHYLDSTIQANTYGGKVYGLPLYIDSGMLYYRRDLLDKYGFKPPETWPEMVRQAGAITAGEPNLYGFSAQLKQYEGLVCNMMEYVAGNQGHLVDPKTGAPAIAEKPALDAVRFVRDRIVGKTAPEGVLTYEEPESLALFTQGKAVFLRSWPYVWKIANNPQRSMVVGKVGVALLPHFPGGKSHATLGGWQVGISAYSENKDLAWTFAQFLSGERIQKHLAVKAGLAPTRTSLYDDADVLNAAPQFREMKPVFFSSLPRPRSPLYPALSNILQRYFSKAISDRRSDLASEARSAAAEMEKTLALTRGTAP
ncbi:MAG: extracellular solute-binding protein [Syntrophaceae bacterium]|nr:extracellular solute-binding protein [Syntrophaceae bacterium]